MIDLEAENRRLREELETLKEEKRQRKQAIESASMLLPSQWRLTKTQRWLLLALLEHPEHIATRGTLMEAIGRAGLSTDRYIDALISKLRTKIRPFGIVILTEWAIGFRLAPESAGLIHAAISRHAELEKQRIDAAAKLYARKTS